MVQNAQDDDCVIVHPIEYTMAAVHQAPQFTVEILLDDADEWMLLQSRKNMVEAVEIYVGNIAAKFGD